MHISCKFSRTGTKPLPLKQTQIKYNVWRRDCFNALKMFKKVMMGNLYFRRVKLYSVHHLKKRTPK